MFAVMGTPAMGVLTEMGTPAMTGVLIETVTPATVVLTEMGTPQACNLHSLANAKVLKSRGLWQKLHVLSDLGFPSAHLH
jgi:hypothetical protein